MEPDDMQNPQPDELRTLQQRIAELERELATTRATCTTLEQRLEQVGDLQDALRQSEERSQRIIEKIPAGVCITNTDGLFEYVNPAYCTLYGYSAEELIGQPFTIVVPYGYQETAMLVHRQFMDEGREIPEEWTVRTKNGESLTILADAAYIIGTDGQPKKVTFVINITERKHAEDQLRLTQISIDRASDGVHWLDMEGCHIYVNDAVCKMLGYTHKELLDMRVQDIAPNIAKGSTWRHIWETIKDQGSLTMESLHRCKDGRIIPVEVTGNYLEFKGEEYIFAFSRDISERKQAEQERATLQAQIIETQQAAIRELSTPLLPLADHVVALPLVGTLDSERAQQVMETLLEGIAHYQADIAIIDITGVRVVDTQVAQALIRTAQAVRLLGAQVVLTGIQPQIAQTLVHLGTDLSNMVTRATLQSGIDYALTLSQHIPAGKEKGLTHDHNNDTGRP